MREAGRQAYYRDDERMITYSYNYDFHMQM